MKKFYKFNKKVEIIKNETNNCYFGNRFSSWWYSM